LRPLGGDGLRCTSAPRGPVPFCPSPSSPSSSWLARSRPAQAHVSRFVRRRGPECAASRVCRGCSRDPRAKAGFSLGLRTAAEKGNGMSALWMLPTGGAEESIMARLAKRSIHGSALELPKSVVCAAEKVDGASTAARNFHGREGEFASCCNGRRHGRRDGLRVTRLRVTSLRVTPSGDGLRRT